MDDSTPDPLPMYTSQGKVYVNIGGTMFQVNATAEAMEVMRQQYEKKSPPKRQTVARAAAAALEAPDPEAAKRMAAHRRNLDEYADAKERFASTNTLRESFGIPSHVRPGTDEYNRAESRYLDRLAKSV